MVKVFYYIKDKDGYAVDGVYESHEELYLWQHIRNARIQSGAKREDFVLVNTSCIPRKKATWVNPDWPIYLVPRKKSKLAFGRYVYEEKPKVVDQEGD